MSAYFRRVRYDALWIVAKVSEYLAVSIFTVVEYDNSDFREDGSSQFRLP